MPIYIPRPTGADSPNTRHEPMTAWHLHVGTVQLFIVGPGTNAWLACSKSYYRGQVGTDEERRLARRAVAILLAERHDDREAGTVEIRAALARAVTEPDREPQPPRPPAPEVDYATWKNRNIADPAPEVAEIVEEVASILGNVTAEQILGRNEGPITRIGRHLAMAVARQRLGWEAVPLAKCFGRSEHAIRYAIQRHDERMHRYDDYRATAAGLGCALEAPCF